MKTTELLVCGSCIVVALLSTIGEASPGWRPQGRFGKRTQMASLPRMIETAGGEEVLMPNVFDTLGENVARLCADPRNADLPECVGLKSASSSSSSSSSSSASRLRRMKALADYFDV